MQKHPDRRWKEESKRFTTFQPKHEKPKPSEWMLVLFMLDKVFRHLHLAKVFSKKGNQETDPPSRNGTMLHWSDLQLPEEPAQLTDPAKSQATGADEGRKKLSIRDRCARLSMVFRRGALSPGTTADV
jgi:hypothetical protein